jgi:hypothetical protein
MSQDILLGKSSSDSDVDRYVSDVFCFNVLIMSLTRCGMFHNFMSCLCPIEIGFESSA